MIGNERTYQQRLVAERLEGNLEKILRYNDDLDKRATLITGASSIIVGIVSAAQFLPPNPDHFTVESLLLGLACACSVIIFFFASQVWKTSLKALPGSTDVRTLYLQYIAQPPDLAFNNSLMDLAHAVNECLNENQIKADAVNRVVGAFQIQIGVLAFAIVWTAVSSIWK